MKRKSYGMRWAYILRGRLDQLFDTKREAVVSLGIDDCPLGADERVIRVEILAAPTTTKRKGRKP